MSYILDALKKSDQERQTHEGPTLQTIHRPARKSESRRLLLVLVILLPLVMVIAAIGVYLWFGQPSARSIDKPLEMADDRKTTVNTDSSAPTVASEPVVAEIKPVATTAVSDGPVVAFSELPDNIRNEIPPLTFSFHVYSQTPASRTIIINKRRVKEGDEVVQGLQLREITAEGVILLWKDHAFYINVVENW